MPSGLALAATFNAKPTYDGGPLIGREALAKGSMLSWPGGATWRAMRRILRSMFAAGLLPLVKSAKTIAVVGARGASNFRGQGVLARNRPR